MTWKLIVGGLLVLILLTVGVGADIYTGVGPAPGDTDSNEQLTDFPTETPENNASSGSATTTAATSTPPFAFSIDTIEECGLTCRDVTVTLRNLQDETATGVTVYTRIFAGKDTTDSADLVWEGKEAAGTLDGGAAHTATKRVDLSLREGQQIEGNGGWVTILTTVETDGRTVTFRDSEQVA